MVAFQSAPDPKAGRCHRGRSGVGSARKGFNPLPTRRSGDANGLTMGQLRDSWFQSAPDPKVGRCILQEYLGGSIDTFQSAPDPKVGRCDLTQYIDRPSHVSIRSRPEGREMLGDDAGDVLFELRFNPLPTRRSGDAKTPEQVRQAILVSIRSRPEGREMRGRAISVRSPVRSFNPLPTRRSGDAREERTLMLGALGFQSAPDPKVGRCN